MKQLTITLSILLCIFLSGCTKDPKIIKINNNNFNDISSTSLTTENGRKYGIFSLESSGNGYCRITVKSDEFVSMSNTITSKSRNNKNLAINCNWNDRYYVQSKSFKSSASISLLNLKPDDHKGTLKISFKLINVPHNEYLELNDYVSIIPEDVILGFIEK